ncbi:MAG: hypothetical protein ABI080_13145 [Candidatus Binatia bacterium]
MPLLTNENPPPPSHRPECLATPSFANRTRVVMSALDLLGGFLMSAIVVVMLAVIEH